MAVAKHTHTSHYKSLGQLLSNRNVLALNYIPACFESSAMVAMAAEKNPLKKVKFVVKDLSIIYLLFPTQFVNKRSTHYNLLLKDFKALQQLQKSAKDNHRNTHANEGIQQLLHVLAAKK